MSRILFRYNHVAVFNINFCISKRNLFTQVSSPQQSLRMLHFFSNIWKTKERKYKNVLYWEWPNSFVNYAFGEKIGLLQNFDQYCVTIISRLILIINRNKKKAIGDAWKNATCYISISFGYALIVTLTHFYWYDREF